MRHGVKLVIIGGCSDLTGQIGRTAYLRSARAYLHPAGLPAFCVGLPTFSEATEMTGHTALFKADRLPTIRTGLSKQAILMFMMSFVVFVI